MQSERLNVDQPAAAPKATRAVVRYLRPNNLFTHHHLTVARLWKGMNDGRDDRTRGFTPYDDHPLTIIHHPPEALI